MNSESSAEKLRILILDDEETIRETFAVFLSKAGFEVVTVSNYTDAIEALSKREFSVAVVDRILSKGEKGLDFIKDIRPLQPNCETILITGQPTFDSAQETIQLRSFAYLTKPVMQDELCFYVEEAARKSMERKNEWKNRELFHSLFDASPNPIVIMNTSGSVAFINKAFSHVFEYTIDEFNYKDEKPVFVPEADYKKTKTEINEVAAGKIIRERETIRLTKKGNQRIVSTSLSLCKTEENVSGYILCLMRDLTRQKEMEKKLHETERLSMLGQLAAKVAHEINNPLQAIWGSVELVRENSSLDENDKSCLDIALEGIDIIKNLTRDLMEVARPQPINFSVFLPHLPVEKAINFLKSSGVIKTFKIAKEFQEDIPNLKGDSRQIQQVFMNLILNASQAMNASSTKELCFRTGYDQDKKLIQMSITDNGCGIEENDQENIFDNFFTTRSENGGTGLGLSVAKNIVQKHGGTIKVNSMTGKGATFTVELPAERQ